MKKIIIVALFLLACLLCSCSVSSDKDDKTVTTDAETSAAESDGMSSASGEMHISSLDTEYGNFSELRIEKDISKNLFCLENISVGDPGLNTNAREKNKELLDRYFSCSTKVPADIEYDSMGRAMTEIDSYRIYAAEHSVEVFCADGFNINVDMTDEELFELFSENEYLNALLKGKDIKKENLFVYRERELKNDDEKTASTYTIKLCKKTDSITDLYFKLYFDSIKFSFVPDAEEPEITSVFAYYYPNDAIKEKTADISYTEAIKTVEDEIGASDMCVIVYGADGDNSVIPYYRFFAENKNGSLIYTDIPCIKQ